jgi:glyoxylase-like metal-dependent hydrolase (beta-lactamase superfamily II)
MKIITIPVGMLQANCYIVNDERSPEALVIDPGAEGSKIQKELEQRGLQIKYMVNTHGHNDHIGANRFLKEATGAPLLIHEADAAMLTDPNLNLSVEFGLKYDKPAADRLLHDGDELEMGNLKFKILHTPGHTPGGICLVTEGVCFSGDTLFDGSIGRTDLPGGSFKEIIGSIGSKLLTLDDNTIVYPGHGPQTTIGREKNSNPYLS